MTAGRLILWRHGQTDYNVGGRVQGLVDIPLNATGLAQAEVGARMLLDYLGTRSEDVLLVASDLQRALATAQVLADLVDLEVQADSRLRERSFGVWEGLTREEIIEGWGTEPIERWAAGHTPEGIGMEPKSKVAERVVAAVREAAATLSPGGTVVAVGHGAALSQGTTLLLGFDPETGSPLRGLDNCHLTDLGHQPMRRPEWVLRAHNIGAR